MLALLVCISFGSICMRKASDACPNIGFNTDKLAKELLLRGITFALTGNPSLSMPTHACNRIRAMDSSSSQIYQGLARSMDVLSPR